MSAKKQKTRVIIMGAAGRDFHNFNVFFRDNEEYEVVCFTATQIPTIEKRKYPAELAGPLYPDGIPIYAEEKLPELVQEHDVDEVVLAYSDLPYEYVMHRSAMVNAAGADFVLMGPDRTMIESNTPVIAVCAVRTGCGKSQVSRSLFKILRDRGYMVASIRHPMPYDVDLRKQECQRFASYDDLDKYDCTIEEREEYEPYIDMGGIVYAGVDYEKILREAEKEADVIIWDGGNNDFPFYRPDLWITVADPHRPGHELRYYPGEVNLRSADIVVINKVNTADRADIEAVRKNVEQTNPDARVIEADSVIEADKPDLIVGKHVLVVEDGPTVTHGDMAYGAGTVAARKHDAASIIDPREHAVGSIVDTFNKHSHLDRVLPAMGYGDKQIQELEETINNTECDAVVSGTPIDLQRVIDVDKPVVRVKYDVGQKTFTEFEKVMDKFSRTIKKKKKQ